MVSTPALFLSSRLKILSLFVVIYTLFLTYFPSFSVILSSIYSVRIIISHWCKFSLRFHPTTNTKTKSSSSLALPLKTTSNWSHPFLSQFTSWVTRFIYDVAPTLRWLSTSFLICYTLLKLQDFYFSWVFCCSNFSSALRQLRLNKLNGIMDEYIYHQ